MRSQTHANREFSTHQSTPGSCVRSAIQAEQPVDQTRPVIPTPGGNSRFSAVLTQAGPTRREVQRYRCGPQHARLAIDHPALGHIEIQQTPDRGKQAGNRLVQPAASRENLHGRVLYLHSPLGPFSLRDVALDGDEVGEPSRLIANGLDLDRRPVFPPPFVVVEQFALETHPRL